MIRLEEIFLSMISTPGLAISEHAASAMQVMSKMIMAILSTIKDSWIYI
jgi:hypothetical protein